MRGGTNMSSKKNKRRFSGVPIENHITAAWANISETKPVSQVTIPDDFHVDNAKEYVDSNQK